MIRVQTYAVLEAIRGVYDICLTNNDIDAICIGQIHVRVSVSCIYLRA